MCVFSIFCVKKNPVVLAVGGPEHDVVLNNVNAARGESFKIRKIDQTTGGIQSAIELKFKLIEFK